ncbi:ABC transporter ATP-binding protein [Kribbella sp. HUAS MG21]|uniref:ABC transporter ATP-binding protein n=1 Tax=Kribbella sp. HUAS MG21 TaxID=3160966 RepID=A0AAU7T8L8_9ACTN
MSTKARLDEAVRLEGVSAYGVRFADLVVRYGEVVALTGSNGSGKTTICRVLVGELAAAGSVEVLGPENGDLTGRIGYLIKDLETMGSLTSRDVLDICAAVRGCGTAYAHELGARLGLEIDRPMGQLSRGQLRRLSIVQALMHDPELIVLDDPMTELDDEGRLVLPGLLREAADRGAAVLMTTQLRSDAELCADRIVSLRSRDANCESNQSDPEPDLEAARAVVVRRAESCDAGRGTAVERGRLLRTARPAVRRGAAERMEGVTPAGDRPGRGHGSGPAGRGAGAPVPDPACDHLVPRLGGGPQRGRPEHRAGLTGAGRPRPG